MLMPLPIKVMLEVSMLCLTSCLFRAPTLRVAEALRFSTRARLRTKRDHP